MLSMVDAHINHLRGKLLGIGREQAVGLPFACGSIPTDGDLAPDLAARCSDITTPPYVLVDTYRQKQMGLWSHDRPPSRSGVGKEGLTETEELRLNRLLRSTAISTPPSVPVSPLPTSTWPASLSSQKTTAIQGGTSENPPRKVDAFQDGDWVGKRQGRRRRLLVDDPDCRGRPVELSGKTRAGRNSLSNTGKDVLEDLMGQDLASPAHGNYSATQQSGFRKNQSSSRDTSIGEGTSTTHGIIEQNEVGGGWKGMEGGRHASNDIEEDDLQDISDGGFHLGCWRRKYTSGEMR